MNIEKLIKIVKLMKHASVGDSDKLKQMAYKFAQMGNYFDRANSARSREILAKEDDQKYAEFYNYGLQVLAQLKQEVEGIKKNATPANYSRSFDNETLSLLNDGANRLYWIASDRRDKKGEVVSKKILELAKEYKRNAYDSVKTKDGWMNVRGTTRQGYEVRAIYNGKSGRLYAVIYRPRAKDFLVAAGYNQQRGDWDQGYYDYKSEEEARKFTEKHARQMGDSVKDSMMTFYGLDKIEKDDEKWFRQKGMQLISQSKDGPGWEYTFRGSKQALLKYVKEQELDEEEYEIKDSVKDVPVGQEPNVQERTIISWRNTTTPKDLQTLLERYNKANGEDKKKLKETIHARMTEIGNDYQADLKAKTVKPEEVKAHYAAYNDKIMKINQTLHENYSRF